MRRAVGRAVATAAGALGVTTGAAGVAVQSDTFEHDQRDRHQGRARFGNAVSHNGLSLLGEHAGLVLCLPGLDFRARHP